MAKQIVWNDEYQGPRYTYYSPLRPVAQLWISSEFTRVISSGQNDREITLTTELSESFVKQCDLILRIGA
jgi:hypothetical protein